MVYCCQISDKERFFHAETPRFDERQHLPSPASAGGAADRRKYIAAALQHGRCLYPRTVCRGGGICRRGRGGVGDEPVSLHAHRRVHGRFGHSRAVLRGGGPGVFPPGALAVDERRSARRRGVQRTRVRAAAAAARRHPDAGRADRAGRGLSAHYPAQPAGGVPLQPLRGAAPCGRLGERGAHGTCGGGRHQFRT